ALFASHVVRLLPNQIQARARAKLLAVDAARQLDDLRVPPGNRLEALHGDRRGQYSIRVNDQWRICFEWPDNAPWQVGLVGSHRGYRLLRSNEKIWVPAGSGLLKGQPARSFRRFIQAKSCVMIFSSR